jgi:DtxR family Mn-dependent transcriptional regulator
MATSTVEDYLKSILLAEQRDAGDRVTTGRIAAALGVAPGTATAMVKTLSDSGLLLYEPYSGVRLSAAGRQLAVHVLRRHRLLELFLVQVLGMDWSEVHDEAERLEHAVSDRLIERVDEMLGHPATDPHGDPIPDSRGRVEQPELASLLGCPLGRPVQVVRVEDQRPEFLQLVEREGLKPGSLVVVEDRDEAADTVALRRSAGERLRLGWRAASKILVEPPAPRAAGIPPEAGGLR